MNNVPPEDNGVKEGSARRKEELMRSLQEQRRETMGKTTKA